MNSKKHIKITGTSNISWKDAIVKTIEDVSRTIYNISSIVILEQRAKIVENKIQEYYVDLDLEFEIDKNMQSPIMESNSNLDE